MDQRIVIFSSIVIFYWLVEQVFNRYLDQVARVPKLTKPFEEIIEIDVRGTITSDSDEEIIEIDVRGGGVPNLHELALPSPFPMLMGAIPFPTLMGGTTIIIEGFEMNSVIF